MEHQIQIRVRYNEVDRMGYLHHGNYAAYFEMGRTELMRDAGIVYKELEEKGIILPLSDFSVKFYNPAFYDDDLTLTTKVSPISGVRLIFNYFLFKKDQKVAQGKTTLVFVDAISRKPIRPPKYLIELFNDNINR